MLILIVSFAVILGGMSNLMLIGSVYDFPKRVTDEERLDNQKMCVKVMFYCFVVGFISWIFI